MKTHPDGRPWEYPWDSWRDGPHYSAGYLRRMRPIGNLPKNAHVVELIDALPADPGLPHLFPSEDYLRRYVEHISAKNARARRLAAVPVVWRQYRRMWRRTRGPNPLRLRRPA